MQCQFISLTEPEDVTLDASFIMFLPGNITDSRIECLGVTASEDNLLEGSEQFDINIIATNTPGLPVTVGMPSTTIVTISDTDGKPLFEQFRER